MVEECRLVLLRRGEWGRRGARLISLHGRRYKLRWSGNKKWCRGVGVLAKEELYDKVVEVRTVNVSCHSS